MGVLILLCAGTPAHAQSPSLMGPLGLNTVPSARMDAAGTVRAGVSFMDPYEQGWIAVQAAPWMAINLRQTAEVSGLRDDPRALYPGVDLKFRLMDESKYRPALAVGLQSAFGHRRMAGEYVALSKRYGDFDFTGGIGWGRTGSAGTIGNPVPLRGGARMLDGPLASNAGDWFKGGSAGVFGGVEYFTPVKGLSLKLDYGADRYRAETAAGDYKAAEPWAAGFNYTPAPWINIGAAVVGGKKIMATLSLQSMLARWPGRGSAASDPPAMHAYRGDRFSGGAMTADAARRGTVLHDIRRTPRTVWAQMDSEGGDALPRQIGRAARDIANHAGPEAEEIIVTPGDMGLSAPPVRIMRRDLEMAVTRHQGSPQEIWQHADVNAGIPADLQSASVTIDRFGPGKTGQPVPRFAFILETQTSLSEDDSGILYRTSAMAEARQRLSAHWMGGGGLRVNGPENLERIGLIRPAALFPVRSDVAKFAGKTVTLDRLYNGYLRSFRNGSVHVMAAAGYLEEMYGGFGGEILYRPPGRTWAVGAEMWEALRRDPESTLGLMLNGDHVLSGHVKAWYEIPDTDLTVGVKAGRYLGQDWGGSVSLTKTMESGVRFEAFATATDQVDFSVLGGTTHLYSGVRLRLPIGNVPYVPRGSEIRAIAAPLGRDFGQSLDSPLPLYEMTEKFSRRAMIRGWNGITE